MKFSFILFYVPFPDLLSAEKAISALLNLRLIACANVYQAQSFYHWQGAIANEGEQVAYLKTLPEKAAEVATVLEKLHPYQVPCIAQTEMICNESYFKWLSKQVRSEI
ncbi:divalent-cation tolerance protein CutA [Hugenholtzia roseola]|uniref:divalent-cation tolerance protein CutA n=1 Tax=Hugenholtzia roseola TaxID=1002 RepID=UPI00042912BF|nr:divalent-cation tolerance protein CutA [Hugenholtzia roseola]